MKPTEENKIVEKQTSPSTRQIKKKLFEILARHSPSKLKFLLILLIVCLPLVTIGILAKQLLPKFDKSESITPITTPTSIPTITPDSTMTTPIIPCEQIGIFISNNLGFSFNCPKNMMAFECENDVNLYTKAYWEAVKPYIDTSNLCKNRQGTIQILLSDKSLYNEKTKDDEQFEVAEKEIDVDGEKAIQQNLKYDGSNIPAYSQFVTFSKKNTFYRIRNLDAANLEAEFTQILSTFKFLDQEQTITGKVIENNLGCEVDVECYLVIDNGSQEIKVVYHYGEWPRCNNTKTARHGMQIEKGDEVEVFASRSSDGLSTCNSEKYYIKTLSNFVQSTGKNQTVKLYYHNLKADPDVDYCYANDYIEKEVDHGNLIENTINLLIEGGAPSEFPYGDFFLKNMTLENGILTLGFPFIGGFTTGGSCRVGIITSSITKTALQFPEVSEVRFDPEVFQP